MGRVNAVWGGRQFAFWGRWGGVEGQTVDVRCAVGVLVWITRRRVRFHPGEVHTATLRGQNETNLEFIFIFIF